MTTLTTAETMKNSNQDEEGQSPEDKHSSSPDEELNQLTLRISYEISSLLTLLGNAKLRYSTVIAYMRSICRDLSNVSCRIDSLKTHLEGDRLGTRELPRPYTNELSAILGSWKLIVDTYTENKIASDRNRRLLEDSYARATELNSQIMAFSSVFRSSEGKVTFAGEKGVQKLAQFREIGSQYDELMVRLWVLQQSMEHIERNTTVLTTHVDELISRLDCAVINSRF